MTTPRSRGASLLGPLAVLVASGVVGCRQAGLGDACLRADGVEVWVERRFPPTVPLADTAFASLSLSITRDSTAPRPAGAVIAVVIAGPTSAPVPDTVRLLSAEVPSGTSLWRGDQLRAGEYTAQLTTAGYTAGPRAFSLAPGERVEVEARLERPAACTRNSAPVARDTSSR